MLKNGGGKNWGRLRLNAGSRLTPNERKPRGATSLQTGDRKKKKRGFSGGWEGKVIKTMEKKGGALQRGGDWEGKEGGGGGPTLLRATCGSTEQGKGKRKEPATCSKQKQAFRSGQLTIRTNDSKRSRERGLKGNLRKALLPCGQVQLGRPTSSTGISSNTYKCGERLGNTIDQVSQ